MAIRKAQKVWLEAESRRWFKIRDNLKLHLKVLHTELVYNLHNVEFDLLDQKARDFASQAAHDKYIIQSHKLRRLTSAQHGGGTGGRNGGVHRGVGQCNNGGSAGNGDGQSDHVFYPRVKNMTTIQLTNKELTFLEKGSKYNITPILTQKEREELAIDSEIACVMNGKGNTVRAVVAEELKKHDSPSNTSVDEIRVAKSLKRKIRDNNLIVTKADKGNSIVILDHNDYIGKVNNIIHSGDFVALRSDPTTRYNTEIKKAIDSSKFVFSHENSSKHIVPMNPQPPVLYGLPKIHKDNVPVRPIVSCIGCPAYQLAKKLKSIIKSKSAFSPKYSLQNTLDLINKVKDVTLPENSLFLSLDVDNLFTNVPYQESLSLLSDLLERRALHPEELNEIATLTKICMRQNYFRFNVRSYSALSETMEGGATARGTLVAKHREMMYLTSADSRVSDTFKSVQGFDCVVRFEIPSELEARVRHSRADTMRYAWQIIPIDKLITHIGY
ncbi:uncharacterized protein [Battus philenor]|uniref:uncharacterized protein n=1 Tax=Battus philenor TaxID=42288 RepID=UPI0035D1268D